MWKTHFQPRRMRSKMFQSKHLTLTHGIFQVNCNTFPELPENLSQHFLTFHSFLVANYSRQASFQRNGVSSLCFHFFVHVGLFQLALRAIWNNLSKKHYSNNVNVGRWRALNPNNLFRNCPNIVLTSLCKLERLVFQATPKLWSIRKTYRKTLMYETTLDHARRP